MSRKKRRICFVSLYAYSLFDDRCSVPHGGSEVQLYQLAKKLAQFGVAKVSFVVGDFGQADEEVFDGIKVVKAFPVKQREFKYITGIFYQLKFFRLLRRVNADVYVQRAAGIETGLLALFCRIFRKKFIYMAASSIDVDGSFGKRDWIANIFYSLGLRNTSKVVVQSEDQRGLLKKNYGKDSVIIKNSFVLPEQTVPREVRRFILWVGSAQNLKQPWVLLDIATKIPSEQFVMIMPKHDESLWKKTQEAAQVIPNLRFIETVPFSEINEYFAKAKLFINTSVFEGFPNTFVQAAMYGVPIVSLNVNPDNFLNEYGCGFCAGSDVAGLVNGVRAVLNDEAEWSKKSLHARHYATENHDIEVNVIKLIHLIDE